MYFFFSPNLEWNKMSSQNYWVPTEMLRIFGVWKHPVHPRGRDISQDYVQNIQEKG